MASPRKYFGTDGVRGPYGSDLMNEGFAFRLGAAAARFAQARGAARGSRVLIGRDTRSSGPSLENALAAGFAAEGLKPVSLGVVPTPAVSLAVRAEQTPLGVVLTASHNPAADNGIKFFGPNGVKLTDDEEAEIEAHLRDDAPFALEPSKSGSGTATATAAIGPDAFDALGLYVASASKLLPPKSLVGWKIVLDTANGAACETSRIVLEKLGADLVLLGNKPDGTNINDQVGSQHPERMAAAVRAQGGKLGIAHDGDADRCILCDESGSVLDGDEILTILAVHALRHDRLARKTLVVTVQSNLGVDAAIAAAGGKTERTPVGDRYVTERMRELGANLGGESSGHVICAEIAPTGDGLAAALRVIEVMLATGQPLSVLRDSLRKFPQRSKAIAVREKKPLENLTQLPAAIRAIETELGPRGRVLVRYSGTEPRIRLLVEGPTDEIVTAALQRLETATRAELVD